MVKAGAIIFIVILLGIGYVFASGYHLIPSSSYTTTQSQSQQATSTSTNSCKPDYVAINGGIEGGTTDSANLLCKGDCYTNYKTTSFKLEAISQYSSWNCLCDINNCNPQ